MKNRKVRYGIAASVLALIAAVVVLVCIPRGTTADPTPVTPVADEDFDAGELQIDDPEEDGFTQKETAAELTAMTVDEDSILTLRDTPVPSDTGKKNTLGKAGQTASPITERTPSETGGITIGDGMEETYDCGTPGHHCDGPETHAYVLNLELEGCPYCGKHDCPSFYATDEWGNTCYTPSQCPQYDAKKDPAVYCQTCGKLCGDGKHDTCVQFVTACHCPNCGLWVEAWTCHTCE